MTDFCGTDDECVTSQISNTTAICKEKVQNGFLDPVITWFGAWIYSFGAKYISQKFDSKYNNFMIEKLSSSSWQAIFGFCGIFVLIVGVIYKQNAQLLQLQRLDVGSLFYLIRIFKEKWLLWRLCQILKAISTNTVMKNRNSLPGKQ